MLSLESDDANKIMYVIITLFYKCALENVPRCPNMGASLKQTTFASSNFFGDFNISPLDGGRLSFA